MRIVLHAEYIKKEDLTNLKYIDFPVDIAIAANDINEFREKKVAARKRSKYVRKVAYWPLLNKKEGYWLSPFSEKNALEGVISELESNTERLPVLWDAELPWLYKRRLFTGLWNFRHNKKRIRGFFENHKKYNLEIATLVYPTFLFFKRCHQGLGLAFENYDVESVTMLYTSFENYFQAENSTLTDNLLRYEAKKGVENYGDEFSMSIGCLSTGALGNEPIISYEKLDRDLEILDNIGVPKVYIYDLKGLNRKYAGILKKFS